MKIDEVIAEKNKQIAERLELLKWYKQSNESVDIEQQSKAGESDV